jgi:probable HAF family extracellular repeat protein
MGTAGLLVSMLAGIAAVLPAGPAVAGPPAATEIDIRLPGFNQSVGIDINDRGQVLASATVHADSTIGRPQGYIWYRGVRTLLEPLPGGDSSLPRDINARGKAAGFCANAEVSARPCLWRRGRAVDLGTLDERGSGTALAINDRGEVVGDNQTYIDGGNTRAFIWRRGVLTDLGGRGSRSAEGINNRSEVIGTFYGVEIEDSIHRGFVWKRGRLTDLGTLGGGATFVRDINDRGQIVGTSTTATGEQRAFLWRAGRMVNLGTLPGGSGSGATSVNERGQVVGWSTTAGGATRPVLWHRGRIADLGILTAGERAGGSAEKISETGVIVGSNWGTSGYQIFSWRRGHLRSVTGPEPLSSAGASAVNDLGTITGWSRPGSDPEHATVWRPGR